MAETLSHIISIGQFRLRNTVTGHVVDFQLMVCGKRHETMTIELHFDAVPQGAVQCMTAMMAPFDVYFADWLGHFETTPGRIDMQAITRFDQATRALFGGDDFAGWDYREMRMNGKPVTMSDLLEIALHLHGELARRSLMKQAA